MNSDAELIGRVYERFNARDIDAILAMLCEDVAWANGMEGGYVHGHEGVRAYWTRQWGLVSPHVEPVRFRGAGRDVIVAEVRQTIRDLQGRPLQDAAFGLQDKIVEHVFQLRDGCVARFDIKDA